MAAKLQEVRKVTPVDSIYHKRKDVCLHPKKRYKVNWGVWQFRTQIEIMIHQVQFTRRTKEATTQSVCTGNVRVYFSEYGNYCFNDAVY